MVGSEAVRVFCDGQRLLKRLVEGRWLTANAVLGFWPANTVNDDDIELYTDESREQVALTWWGVRLQTERPVIDGVMRPNRCLADFIAPRGVANDYIGAFAVTAGLGVDAKEDYFLDDHDDYSAIMLKALADRLAEAFAECLHQRVRTDLWGYAAGRAAVQRGTDRREVPRHPPGARLPGLPRPQRQGAAVRAAGRARASAWSLTDSGAMTPAASVSGFYLSHPQSTYFNVGRIGDDQLEDLARRRGAERAQVERLLGSNL